MAPADRSCLRAIVEGHRVQTVFRRLFRALPTTVELEVRLLGFWEDAGVTEVWRASEDCLGGDALTYVESSHTDLLSNGFVAIAVHSRDRACTLRLTEHKLLEVSATERRVLEPMEAALQEMGFERQPSFRSVATHYQHFHFLPKGALSPVELRQKLARD